MDYTIGGIAAAALIIGLVEFAKKFGLQGRACTALAFGLGVLFAAIGYGIQQQLIPPGAVPYLTWGIVALAAGPLASGYVDLSKKFQGGGGS